MIIRDILTFKEGILYSVTPEQTVSEVLAQMVQAGIGSLVVHKDGFMVGLITERDLLRGINSKGAGVLQETVSQWMVTEPIIGSPEDTIDYVRGVMTENRITHLPVMEGDNVIGVISFYDVAKACLNAVDFENRLLKRYIKHWPDEQDA